jgi:outer membrane protein assembly factor BamB
MYIPTRFSAILVVCCICQGLLTSCIDAAGPKASTEHDVGTLLWRTEGSGYGTPVFDSAGVVYYLRNGHNFTAVSGNDSGRVLWQSYTQDLGEDWYGGQSSVVVDSLVVAGDLDLYAYSRSTGQRQWTFKPQVGYWPGLFDLVMADKIVYAGSPSAYVYAVDGHTGSQKWATRILIDTALVSVFGPSADSDIVVASFTRFNSIPDGGVVALDAKTGAIRWRTFFPHTSSELGTGSPGGALLTPTAVIAAAADGPLYSLDRNTGEIQWSTKRLDVDSVYTMRDIRYLALSKNRVVVTSASGYAAAYNVLTGTRLWVTQTELYNSQSAVAADDSIAYISHLGGVVVAVDAATGAIRWKVGNHQYGFVSRAAVDSDRIYVVGTAGLYAIKK